eukprot:TRINITY_DN1090_c0_g1_i1.p1 TRINITY_DN1090_c0_g1~~TRINITY_DN1090_c0_g1_i1.p1  ORF type:complete len:611 (-),score=246.25 TRINITY_DN1090_c0_g1_i1:98-1930(-)
MSVVLSSLERGIMSDSERKEEEEETLGGGEAAVSSEVGSKEPSEDVLPPSESERLDEESQEEEEAKSESEPPVSGVEAAPEKESEEMKSENGDVSLECLDSSPSKTEDSSGEKNEEKEEEETPDKEQEEVEVEEETPDKEQEEVEVEEETLEVEEEEAKPEEEEEGGCGSSSLVLSEAELSSSAAGAPSCTESDSKDDIIVLESPSPKYVSTPCKPPRTYSDREWFESLSEEELSWYSSNGPGASHFESKTLQCTGCSSQILNSGNDTVFRHPSLGVAICRTCKNYYEKGEWTKDEEGYDVYCLWCGNGGDLILCDFCSHSFCKRCIHRNLGRKMLTEISKADTWKCLHCKPNLIYYHRAIYHAFVQHQAEQSLTRRKSTLKKKEVVTSVAADPTDNFLDDNIGEAFKTLSIYQKCLEDERRRWIKCKKRMDLDAAGAIARNLRKIYAITKQNMNLLDADLIQSFANQFPGVSTKKLDVTTGVEHLVKKRKRDLASTTPVMPPTNGPDEFIVNGSPVTADYHGPEVDEEFDPSALLQVEFRETSTLKKTATRPPPPPANPRFILPKPAASNEIEVLTLDSDDDDDLSSPPTTPPFKKRRSGPKSKTMYLD